VLASSDFHDALGDDPAFRWQRLRSRRVRDIGRVEVWLLERAEQTVAEALPAGRPQACGTRGERRLCRAPPQSRSLRRRP